MANVTDLYIDRLYEMSKMELPASTISEARKCLMDFLACTFAGAATLREEQGNFLNAFPASAEATVIGMGRKANLYNAALVNAFNSHVVELDDGHRFCMAHLEAPILPAVLAAAEIEGINGKQLLYALDGGWFLTASYKYLQNRNLDMMILDATCGDYVGDYRMGEHNSIPMIRLMLPSLKTWGAINDQTEIYLSHLAPKLHVSHDETVDLVAKDGMKVAYDGLELEF
jgi:hypothetical protein